MVGNRGALPGGGLGRAHVEAAVDLLGVGVHDLAPGAARELDGEARLARGGGAGQDGDEREGGRHAGAYAPTQAGAGRKRAARSASATGVSSRVAMSFSLAWPLAASLPPSTTA